MSDNGNESDVMEIPAAIVGVGASAGGLEACGELLAHLAPNTGMALVLVQHLDPTHESQLTDLLSRATQLPVVEAGDGMAVRPDHIYVMPSNVTMTIEHGVLQLKPRSQERGLHLPIDQFFRSLAADQGSRAMSVVLSGTASDGTLGSAEVKGAGGITFAQDPQTAKFSGMPMSAIQGGSIDFILPANQIAEKLAAMCRHPYQAGEDIPPAMHGDDEPAIGQDLRRILQVLQVATGTDFTGYRDTTVSRRIHRRVALRQQESPATYLKLLKSDRTEVDALYRDLLINVTSFFRDPEVFEMLKTIVFPAMMKGKSAEVPIRIWVPGCSTGQEAYSLAMAIFEFLDTQPMRPPVQIFGTDINDTVSVERARAGYYVENIEAEVSPERLRRFFAREDGGYRVRQCIREMCIFARHDITTDAPFSKLDLISCRNLLIYLSLPLQQRIIPMFHYALAPAGFLLLGLAESIGRFSDLFAAVDPDHRIYSKTSSVARTHPYLMGNPFPNRSTTVAASNLRSTSAPADLQKEADRLVLSRYAPAGVLVNDSLEVLQFRGRTAPYLEPPLGEASLNLLRMVRESLFGELRTALEAARKQNATIRKEGVTLRDGQETRTIALEVIPVKLPEATAGGFLVLFEAPLTPRDLLTRASGTAGAEDAGEGTDRLRAELADVREYLQSIIDRHAARNEELTAATEEVMSMNEELQSTNEEMQTAKEELQSTNEELQTLNEELQSRNREVSQSSDDLANLLSSIMLPIVMVGMDLRIRRFTPSAAKLLNLIATDIGRPLGHIRPAIPLPDLEPLVEEVTSTVAVVEREIAAAEDRWYQLRLHPYRTADHRIDGAVLVIRDITDVRQAEQVLRSQVAEATDTNAAKDQFLATLSHELRTPLSPVLLAASVLENRPDLPPDMREEIALLRRNVELEARLVDDLLDVTRIAKGKVEMNLRPHDACELLRQAVAICNPDMEAKQIQVNIELKAERACVMADAARLQQVFWNLLRNAVKFTPARGRIDIRCRNEADRVIFEFSDNGIGIEPEVLPRLFRTFEQGTKDITRQFGGLGLGLAISRMIVELHHGSIGARSPGKNCGATFTVTLLSIDSAACETARQALADTAIETRVTHPGARLLLVEDHADTAKLMALLLKSIDCHVMTAGDIATAKKLAAEQKFDLVISDLGLPDGNGTDLMAYLRREYGLRGIALTGYGMEKDREETLAAGFVEHMVKPIDFQTLKAALQRCL